MKIELPKIQTNVPGPDGQPGFLLIVPRDEALEWDIQDEIVSTSRYWVQDRQAWWVAAAYLHTAQEIVHRFTPSAPAEKPPAPLPPPPAPRRLSRWQRLLSALRNRWIALSGLLRRRPRAPASVDPA